jgi:hypothetical protein
MESKTARLTVLIDPVKKKAFEELCAAQDVTPSQVVRQLIRDYLETHVATYATKRKHASRPSTTRWLKGRRVLYASDSFCRSPDFLPLLVAP